MFRYSLTSLLMLLTCVCVIAWLWTRYYPLGPLLSWFVAAGWIGVAAVRTRNGWLGAVAATMFFLSYVGGAIWMMEAHAVRPTQLARIRPGLRQDEVLGILGPPATSSTVNTWTYSGATWCLIRIRFDKNGFVAAVEHDH